MAAGNLDPGGAAHGPHRALGNDRACSPAFPCRRSSATSIRRPEQAAADLAAALKRRPPSTGASSSISAATGARTATCSTPIFTMRPTSRSSMRITFWCTSTSGGMDQNLDIAERYQIPLNKGVPALAVLNSKGKLLYSQKGGRIRGHAAHGIECGHPVPRAVEAGRRRTARPRPRVSHWFSRSAIAGAGCACRR